MTTNLESQLRSEIVELRKAIGEIHKCALFAKHHNRYYQQMHSILFIAGTHVTPQLTPVPDSPEITAITR